MGDGDFAGEGAGGFVEDVLGGYFNARVKVFAGEEEEEARGGDNDL